MYENDPIRVFVTHNFKESDDYLRVFEFLESVEKFFYLNVSKPENVPTGGGMEALKDELIAQIKLAESVIVPASSYLHLGDLIRYQLDVADANGIPVIAIKPFGGIEETPAELIERAAEHVPWNEREFVDALKRTARLEDTARWETVEFTLD